MIKTQIATQIDIVPMMQEVNYTVQTQGLKGAYKNKQQHLLLFKHMQ